MDESQRSRSFEILFAHCNNFFYIFVWQRRNCKVLASQQMLIINYTCLENFFKFVKSPYQLKRLAPRRIWGHEKKSRDIHN